jgi:hypothetical protein
MSNLFSSIFSSSSSSSSSSPVTISASSTVAGDVNSLEVNVLDVGSSSSQVTIEDSVESNSPSLESKETIVEPKVETNKPKETSEVPKVDKPAKKPNNLYLFSDMTEVKQFESINELLDYSNTKLDACPCPSCQRKATSTSVPVSASATPAPVATDNAPEQSAENKEFNPSPSENRFNQLLRSWLYSAEQSSPPNLINLSNASMFSPPVINKYATKEYYPLFKFGKTKLTSYNRTANTSAQVVAFCQSDIQTLAEFDEKKIDITKILDTKTLLNLVDRKTRKLQAKVILGPHQVLPKHDKMPSIYAPVLLEAFKRYMSGDANQTTIKFNDEKFSFELYA